MSYLRTTSKAALWTTLVPLVVLVMGLTPVIAAADSATSGWSIQDSPNQPDALQSDLNAVACADDGTCMAVGRYLTFQGRSRTLAERWNGSTWEIERTVDPRRSIFARFNGVACPSPNLCMAVGTSVQPDRTVGLIERWDGTSWTRVPTPRPHGARSVGFEGVSCTGPADCMAVGSFARSDAGYRTVGQPLAEHWDGTSWRVEPTPDPHAPGGSSLEGVSCTAPTACEAVGNYGYGGFPFHAAVFAMGWDGQSWTYQDQPNPGDTLKNYDYGVSCSGPAACTSVGTWHGDFRYHALAERWDGSSWSRQRAPNPPDFQDSDLNGVSCPDISTCVAVGYWAKNKYGRGGGMLVERWDGQAWTIESAPEPPDGKGRLSGVVCPSPTTCVAVGSRYGSGGSATLIEVYSG